MYKSRVRELVYEGEEIGKIAHWYLLVSKLYLSTFQTFCGTIQRPTSEDFVLFMLLNDKMCLWARIALWKGTRFVFSNFALRVQEGEVLNH